MGVCGSTTRPEVVIDSPANGAHASGIVSVSATATDNVGVRNLEISYWNYYLGQEIILGSAFDSGSQRVDWDTRGLPSGTYAIHALASDAIGNWQRSEVSVHVGDSGGQDPDGDGHDNLMELALGTPPMESNPGTVVAVLEPVGEARHLQTNAALWPLAEALS